MKLRLTASIFFLLLLVLSVNAQQENFVISATPQINVFECASGDSLISVTNIGSVTSVYSLYQEGVDWAFLIFPTVTLAPGQQATIPVYYQTPCGVKGKNKLKSY